MATRRARKREEKTERRGEMMAAAERVFARRPWPEITIAEVAREAGVAKSTVFLYFPTRESLFLLVLEKLFKDFFDELTQGQQGRSTPTLAARWLAGLIEEHALLTRLLGFLPQLEQNVEEARLVRFREFVFGNLMLAGDSLEERLTILAPGDGARWLLRALAFASGIRQFTEPASILREVFRKPDLGRVSVDFRGELIRGLTALTAGMALEQRTDS